MEYEKMQKLKNRIIECGKRLGFPVIKVTDTQPFLLWKEAVDYRKQIDPDTGSSWDRRKIQYDVNKLMPRANSIIVGVRPYMPYSTRFPQGYARYSAHYSQYPQGRAAMGELAKLLTDEGFEALVDAPIPVKAAAHRSSIGYFGKNGVIHTKEYGSFITLHTILTDAGLPIDEGYDKITDCGDCNKCINACPTAAIGENGAIIQSRCIRYNMGLSDFIPREIREKMGSSILGCDACQYVCPRNLSIIGEAGTPPIEEMQPFYIKSILSSWKTGLKSILEPMGNIIGKNYARAQKVLSMAVIAAGNSQDSRYIPYLSQTISHPHPPIRAYSAWALGKIGGQESRHILIDALDREQHLIVMEEIEKAIDSM